MYSLRPSLFLRVIHIEAIVDESYSIEIPFRSLSRQHPVDW